MSDGHTYECDLSAKEFVEKADGVEWVITGDGDYVRVSQISRIVNTAKDNAEEDFKTLIDLMFHRTKEEG